MSLSHRHQNQLHLIQAGLQGPFIAYPGIDS
jgi:hypothetical protein